MKDAATPSSPADRTPRPAPRAGRTVRRGLADFADPEPAPRAGALAAIRRANEERGVWTVVVDDDPTGTQTVRGLPVLLPGHAETRLRAAARPGTPLAFVLTNSRSVDGPRASALTYDTVSRSARAAAASGRRLRVISRSDSTLRGHFAVELDAVGRALADSGGRVDGVLFVPCFLEAGRYTAGNVQWVSTPDGDLVPAADTEFAADSTFGYTEADLADWVRARLRRPALTVASISLAQLRAADGVTATGRRLRALSGGEVIIANAAHPADLETLMLALLEAEARGGRYMIRSGPSFVRLCAGQPPAGPLTPGDIRSGSRSEAHGLVVAGSHTSLTNRQLAVARRDHDLATVELDVPAVLSADPARARAAVDRCAEATLAALRGRTALLRTSRTVMTRGRATPLLVGRAVADALSEVVARIVGGYPLRFLVAKGGITSSDLAHRALGATTATVVGQMLPGQLPLWRLTDGRRADLPYVVFPGNVGADDSLSRVLTTLRRQR
jgi:uncharacterized protein YgbK (DUF1537 family)